jgi:peptidoglycan/xylan/chitin deacetylase (PgdA/CDA1 family)/GT2 family glycosyltransferase
MSPIPCDLSIVIPTYNRRTAVVNLVEALLRQERPNLTIEIIVVVDGSSDGTAKALNTIDGSADAMVEVISTPNSGRAAARNTGIARCTGRFVLFLDDDVLPIGSLLAAHVAADEGADVVLGRIEPGDNPHELKVFRSLSEQFYQDRHQRLATPNVVFRATDVFAGNLSVRRSLLELVGGFDSAYSGYGCEDWDLGQRLIEAGATIAYAPDAAVVHHAMTTPDRWLQDAREEAITQQRLVEKHPGLIRDVTLGGLHEDPIVGRSIAHFAVQFPRLAQIAGSVAIRAVDLMDSLPVVTLNRRVAAQSWQLHFWSAVSQDRQSPHETRERYEFHGRILCYHRIAEDPNPALAEFAMRPDDFRTQMRWLRDNGWTVMSLTDMLDAFEAGRTLHKAVALTFDDGYQDLLDQALPILQEFGYPATAFVVTSLFGRSAGWDAKYGGEMAPLANLDDIKVLEAAGWEIGHHTRTHPALTELDGEQLEDEIAGGKRDLEKALGHPVQTFAYPYGIHDVRVRRATKRAGFRAGLALESRVASSRSPEFATERVCVLRDHTLRDFQSLLWFGWDIRGSLRHLIGSPGRLLKGPVETVSDPPL